MSEKEQIVSYAHCRQCFAELPDGMSMEEWARLSVGLTPLGLQVWCVRHGMNVVHYKAVDPSTSAVIEAAREAHNGACDVCGKTAEEHKGPSQH